MTRTETERGRERLVTVRSPETRAEVHETPDLVERSALPALTEKAGEGRHEAELVLRGHGIEDCPVRMEGDQTRWPPLRRGKAPSRPSLGSVDRSPSAESAVHSHQPSPRG